MRERLNLAGSPVLLTDTAGLRDSEDEVEAIVLIRPKMPFLMLIWSSG